MTQFQVQGRQIAAVLLALMGLVVMAGLLTHHPEWGRVYAGSSLPSFNLGLFILLSARMAWDEHSRPNAVTRGAAWVTVLLSILILLETLVEVDLGVDWVSLHRPHQPDLAHPGRTAPNTCLAFLLAGLAVLAQGTKRPFRGRPLLVSALVHASLGIGLIALAGYALDLQAMYRLMSYNRMSLLGAVALVVLGLSLLATLVHRQRPAGVAGEENRITGAAVGVLTMVAALSGLAAFAVLQHSYKASIADRLRENTASQAISFAHSLRQDMQSATAIAANFTLQDLMIRLGRRARDAQAQAQLRDIGDSLHNQGFDHVRLSGRDGQTLAEVGLSELANATVRVPLGDPGFTLFWQDGLMLRSDTPVISKGQLIGTVSSEMRLTVLTGLLKDLQGVGESTDALVCGRIDDDAVCFPTRFYAGNRHIPLYKHGQPAWPIAKALLGQSGAEALPDLRGVLVQAGYAPVGDLHLGMVIKTDAGELYAPIRSRLNIVAALLVVFVACGTWLLRARVHPLVRQVAQDQRNLRAILETSHEAFVAMDAAGIITEWNRQAEQTFGWTRAEAVGRSMHDLIVPPAFRAAHLHGFKRFLATGKGTVLGKRLELTALRKGGEAFPVEITISQTGDQGTHCFAAFMHDISQRKAVEQRLHDSERQLKMVADNLPALVFYIDAQERYRFANARYMPMLGVDPATMIGRTVDEVLGAETAAWVLPNLRTALAGESVHFTRDSVIKGREVHFMFDYMPDVREDGTVQGVYGMALDITQRRQAELRQAESEERLRTITDNLPAVITYVDKDYHLRFCNLAFEKWLGIPVAQAVGRPVEDVLPESILAERRPWYNRALQGEQVQFEMASVLGKGPSHMQVTYIPHFGQDGAVQGFYTLSMDITARKEVERKLEMLARFDVLTGLANRRQFEEQLTQAMARCRRSQRGMALLFLDVDKFKAINDSLGHAAGDEVLKEFALRLTRCVRVTDTVARLAGDEFIIIVEGLTSIDDREVVARKILADMASPFEVFDQTVPVSTSIGVAVFQGGDETEAMLMAQADKALYEAKASGRNAVRSAFVQVA
ncbi:MAG: diguanylate cyclase [Rubrivivax sp.]|nr:MAG: diguanylate cyclase [Rubrivivax sp.]